MQMPNIRSTIKDPRKKITYHVMAYRTLTREELVVAVQQYNSQKKNTKTKLGEE
jgi:hypothetical protein